MRIALRIPHMPASLKTLSQKSYGKNGIEKEHPHAFSLYMFYFLRHLAPSALIFQLYSPLGFSSHLHFYDMIYWLCLAHRSLLSRPSSLGSSRCIGLHHRGPSSLVSSHKHRAKNFMFRVVGPSVCPLAPLGRCL